MRQFFRQLSSLFKQTKHQMSNSTEVLVDHEIKISFNVAKTEGKGEDADPISLAIDKRSFLSVCDGLGGAGSTTYDIEGEKKSGAYLSSRIVNKQAALFFSDLIEKREDFGEDKLDELKSVFLNSLQSEFAKVKNEGGSMLKSRMLKNFPTTFSAMLITKGEEAADVHSIWAGDSRNYVLSCSQGLQQLTVDDLKQKLDPFENLTKDSPLNNVVSADGDFQIRYKNITCPVPCVLFSVTDGCYGYYSTPMHFEYSVLQALQNANDTNEWSDNLITEFKAVAGDDFSISLVALGYRSFKDLKSQFKQRQEDLYLQFLRDLLKNDGLLKDLSDKKKLIDKDLNQVNLERGELQETIWNQYKEHYLKFIE